MRSHGLRPAPLHACGACKPSCDPHAQPTREYQRPDNQLALSEAALAEEIPRMLNANNPVAPKNLARCGALAR